MTDLSKMLCPKCAGVDRVYIVKLVPTNRPDLPHHPKFIPQVKESCESCKKFIKFAFQTPELINKLNRILKEVPIYE